MALKIVEFFGYDPQDHSAAAADARAGLFCPFLEKTCVKRLSDGTISGACTASQSKDGEPIIVCPVRLYDNKYRILLEVAEAAFGPGVRLVHPSEARQVSHDGRNVVYLGKGVGKELKLPQVSGRGGFFVDWVLALIGRNGSLAEFVAVEVQSIDTTGNYREQRAAYLAGREYGYSKAGVNWENVSKRILPQIIYKAHVLNLERLCKGGLFFVCPGPVYKRIVARLGSDLRKYPKLGPGTVTFRWYNPGLQVMNGLRRGLVLGGQFTTTVEQIALGFTAPKNLPPENAYEKAIVRELSKQT